MNGIRQIPLICMKFSSVRLTKTVSVEQTTFSYKTPEERQL